MVTLAPMYRADNNTSPIFIMDRDSLAKVLNVVNPPQKPVTRSSFISGENAPLPTIPMKRPISSEPTIFTVNVPQGHELTFKPENR